MRIRLATIEDEGAVLGLRSELWPETPESEHRADIHAILVGKPRSTLPLVVYVAENDGELVGFVEVGLRSHADGCDPRQPCGFLEGWYVRPSFAGQGVGRALVEQAEAWAASLGCVELASDTWQDRDGAQRAHEALGFEVVDRCVNFRKALAIERPLPSPPGALYEADLARIHHEHFAVVAEAASDELLAQLEARGLTSGTVVDLAAGSGILARRLLAAGFDVLGVDLSPDMLRLARTEAAAARFVRASLWEVDLPPCVAVTAVGEALCYASDVVTPDQTRLVELLGRIRLALSPGGLLLFDVAGPGRSGPTGSRQVFWEKGEAWISLEERSDEEPPGAGSGRLVRTLNLFVPQGSLYRRSREVHTLTLYTPEIVESALREAGFLSQRLKTYATMPPLPGWFPFVATQGALSTRPR